MPCSLMLDHTQNRWGSKRSTQSAERIADLRGTDFRKKRPPKLPLPRRRTECRGGKGRLNVAGGTVQKGSRSLALSSNGVGIYGTHVCKAKKKLSAPTVDREEEKSIKE